MFIEGTYALLLIGIFLFCFGIVLCCIWLFHKSVNSPYADYADLVVVFIIRVLGLTFICQSFMANIGDISKMLLLLLPK